MDRKALLLGLLIVLVASAAAAKRGRYPIFGIGVENGFISATSAVGTGCTLPFTLPCTLG